MSEIVCQVGNQASQVEFIWSSRGGYFKPYVVAGMQLTELRQAADQTRKALEELVFTLNDVGSGPAPWEPSFRLVEAGFRLFNYLLPSEDETAHKVRCWLEDLRKQSGLIGLEVVVEERSADAGTFLSVPWNLVYDERPAKYKAAFQKGQGVERWRPFWSARYNLTSGRRVEPLKRLPLWIDPRVVVVLDPTVHEGLNNEQKGRLDGFLTEAALTTVGSLDELEAALEEGYPRLLYWLGHATPEYLMLGDKRIAPGDLRNLLRSFDNRERPEGMLAFLNACQTAESGSGGSFLDVLHSFGFTGAIATERQTIDTFANEFGLAFLQGFLREGKPLGELLHGLRLERAPLGLLYGAHCPPEIMVRSGNGAADVPAPLPIRESGPVAGVALGLATLLADGLDTRAADRSWATPMHAAGSPLPDEPYRSLAFYDEKDRALFTGRDADVVRFAATLDLPDTRILILHGESGTGKSSFLRAGVIPYLEEECVGYRFFRRPDGAVLIIQAAKDLVGQLAQALLDATATLLRYDTPDGEPHTVNLRRVLDEILGTTADYATLREALRHDVHLLADMISRMAGRLPYALVLVLDQAEEVFTLAKTAEEVAGRDHGLRMLQRLVDVQADVKLIVSLRTEYYGRLLDHLRAGRRDLTGVRDDLLRDFSRSALIEAITRPTSGTPLAAGQPAPREKYGFRYAEGIPGEIAEGVLTLRSEHQDSVLPLVQVICTQLYERKRTQPSSDGVITREDLDAIKGVVGGLKAFAEDALARSMRLGPEDRDAFKALFCQLYNRQPDGTLTTWLMPRERLEGQWDRPSPFADVLDAAKLVRLLREDELRVEGSEPRRYIRLGHDALAKVAAAWKAEREEKERLEEERTKRRRQRRRLAGVAVFSLTLAGLFGLLGLKATREAQHARTAEKKATELARVATTAQESAKREAANALKAEAEAMDAAGKARRAEEEARSQARVAQVRLQRTAYDQVDSSLDNNDPDKSLEILLDPRFFPALEDRDFAWWYFHRLGDLTKARFGYRGAVESLAFAPGGKTLASVNDDGTVRLWDAATGELRRTLAGHKGQATCVAFAPGGKALASAGRDGTVRLWDADTGASKRVLKGHEGTVRSVAYSPDGKALASAGDDKIVRLWDADTGASKRVLKGHEGAVRSVAYSPDGKALASAGDDKIVRLWDADTGASKELKGHKKEVWSVAFSPDGKTLASAGADMTLRLWDVESGCQKGKPMEGHADTVLALAFRPGKNGLTLASACIDGTVMLWDVKAGQRVAHVPRAHRTDGRPGVLSRRQDPRLGGRRPDDPAPRPGPGEALPGGQKANGAGLRLGVFTRRQGLCLGRQGQDDPAPRPSLRRPATRAERAHGQSLDPGVLGRRQDPGLGGRRRDAPALERRVREGAADGRAEIRPPRAGVLAGRQGHRNGRGGVASRAAGRGVGGKSGRHGRPLGLRQRHRVLARRHDPRLRLERQDGQALGPG